MNPDLEKRVPREILAELIEEGTEAFRGILPPPRVSLCRIGPRRQGSASPLRALDRFGSIRRPRCLQGERGVVGLRVSGRGRAERNLSAILDALSRNGGAESPAGP